MQRIHQALKQYWGYDTFRPLQREAMESVLAGRDSVTILPTGGGKSLCFQAPAVAMEGMAVVVSPLIALMKDQVDALNACGVPAACIHGQITDRERRDIDNAIRAESLKLLYVTPERLAKPRFIEYLRARKLSFVAVDEAHCISMWGHDFRPEYRELKNLRATFPGIGLHAYTATATPAVQRDIVESLELNEPNVHVGSFDRPNLVYRVRERKNLQKQLGDVIEAHNGESGIVYCIRRQDTEDVAAALSNAGHRALPYHAGMPDADRKANQEAFIREEVDIIVATIAFGMGIDKSNVRFVVHAGLPKSLEHYQQESGRAGRDGLEAECVLLYGAADYGLWRRLLGKSEDQAAEVALSKLNDLYQFCTTAVCRHTHIVQYFGQSWSKENCGACDVCLGEVQSMDGADDIAKTICEAVRDLDGRFGGGYLARLLAGKTDERMEQYHHTDLSSFNALESHRPNAIRGWIEQLVADRFLEKTGDYNVIQLTRVGRALLAGENSEAPRLLEPKRRKSDKRRASATGGEWEGVDRELFEALRALRKELAAEQGKPPYVIFGDKALRDMARKRPSNPQALLAVHGVGRKKCKAFGPQFLEAIREHCQTNSVDTDVGIEVGEMTLDD